MIRSLRSLLILCLSIEDFNESNFDQRFILTAIYQLLRLWWKMRFYATGDTSGNRTPKRLELLILVPLMIIVKPPLHSHKGHPNEMLNNENSRRDSLTLNSRARPRRVSKFLDCLRRLFVGGVHTVNYLFFVSIHVGGYGVNAMPFAAKWVALG